MKKLLFIATLLPFFYSFAASAKDVVVIGDSLTCGTLGWHLFYGFKGQGDTVTVFCATSAWPSSWIQGKSPPNGICQTQSTAHVKVTKCNGNGKLPLLQNILDEHRAADIVVILGSNSLAGGKADSSYATMASIIRRNGNRCLWVGPPQMNPNQAKPATSAGRVRMLNKNLPGFYRSLNANVSSNCNVLDSRVSTAPSTQGNRTVNGVHRSDAGGKAWANAIISELQ